MNKLNKDLFIETQLISDIALTYGKTTNEIYDMFRPYLVERNEYWLEQINSGIEVELSDESTVIAPDYIDELVNEGKSIASICRTVRLPYKSVEKYLTFIGETTTANADEHLKPLIQEYARLRDKSREIYYNQLSQVLKDEREAKNKLATAYMNSYTKKKVISDGVSIRKTNKYNKRSVNVSELAKHFSEEQLSDMFGIEVIESCVISTGEIDNKYK